MIQKLNCNFAEAVRLRAEDNASMDEKMIKEMCKQIVERRNDLDKLQKEILKEAIECSQNLEQLLYTAIVSSCFGN